MMYIVRPVPAVAGGGQTNRNNGGFDIDLGG